MRRLTYPLYMAHCIVWCAVQPFRRKPHRSTPIDLRFPLDPERKLT